MIKYKEALLLTGCKTVEEFEKAFYDHKDINYTTSDIRKEYCDKCNTYSNCSECDCFIYDSLQEIYKDNPFA